MTSETTSGQVFPQHGDEPDAANFAHLAGQANNADYVEEGLSLSADFSTPSVDLSAGKAYVLRSTMDTASGDIDPPETRSRALMVVELSSAVTDVPLTDGDVNHVYLDANVGATDSPEIVVNTSDSAPSDAALKLGEVDTANDSVTEVNRGPDVSVATASVNEIVDNSGTNRVEMLSHETNVKDQDGKQAISAENGLGYFVHARSDTPFVVFDNESSSNAVRYTTGSSTGSLELTNAKLTTSTNGITPIDLRAQTFDNDTGISVIAENSDEGAGINTSNQATGGETWTFGQNPDGDFTLHNYGNFNAYEKFRITTDGNIQIGTEQSIDDGSGKRRFWIKDDRTHVEDDLGQIVTDYKSGSHNRIISRNGQPFAIYDEQSDVDAVQYFTDGTVGTLELTNADLTFRDPGSSYGDIATTGTHSKLRGSGSLDVDDDESVTLQENASKSRINKFLIVNQDANASAFCVAAGSVSIVHSEGDWATSDTDGHNCLYIDGGDLVYKNRTGNNGTRIGVYGSAVLL